MIAIFQFKRSSYYNLIYKINQHKLIVQERVNSKARRSYNMQNFSYTSQNQHA